MEFMVYDMMVFWELYSVTQGRFGRMLILKFNSISMYISFIHFCIIPFQNFAYNTSVLAPVSFPKKKKESSLFPGVTQKRYYPIPNIFDFPKNFIHSIYFIYRVSRIRLPTGNWAIVDTVMSNVSSEDGLSYTIRE